jgi:O-antigen/teichoic acid export membrane protein
MSDIAVWSVDGLFGLLMPFATSWLSNVIVDFVSEDETEDEDATRKTICYIIFVFLSLTLSSWYQKRKERQKTDHCIPLVQ